jgi:hypothetical protein
MNIKNEIRKIIKEVFDEYSNEIWYHGTPDVRELEKDGGFTQRYLIIDYVEDPDEWDRKQQELADARKSGSYPGSDDPSKYFKILDTVGDLRKQTKIRKPIFLANEYHVAKTYADPRRAFDYQNAEEKVIKVKVNRGNGVKINAYGQRFRFINIVPVIKGFIEAGANPDKLDKIIRQLNFAQGTKDGIRTDDIAAIGDWLGFDYIDVVGVLDSYHGGSIKSTVRMVFNPNDIEIIK